MHMIIIINYIAKSRMNLRQLAVLSNTLNEEQKKKKSYELLSIRV